MYFSNLSHKGPESTKGHSTDTIETGITFDNTQITSDNKKALTRDEIWKRNNKIAGSHGRQESGQTKGHQAESHRSQGTKPWTPAWRWAIKNLRVRVIISLLMILTPISQVFHSRIRNYIMDCENITIMMKKLVANADGMERN